MVDPYLLLFTKNNIENIIYKKNNTEKDLTIKVLIPTRLDEHKNVQLFYEMLPEVVKDVDFNIKFTHIVWPGTVDTFINKVLPTYKLLTKNKNIKFKILPLQNRYDLLSLYLNSNVVIGQFKLGILSLVELEALATLNHVIISRLNIRTRACYSSEVPVCSIKDSSELGKCFDRIIREPANLTGLEFIERYHSIEKVINMLLSYYYNIIHW
jgi:glycosyltransferase involved in cell wall biosynthesis